MMIHDTNNIYTLSNIYIIILVLFLHHKLIISSKIVIPFSHYNLNSESFIQNNFENSIYSEIQAGTYNSFPEGKKIIIFLNTQKNTFSISDLKSCPSNSFYNKNESKSYQYKNGLSQDSFYLYNDIKLEKKEKLNEINFEYKEKYDKKIFCGMIGFNMLNEFDNKNYNFLYNLKKNNYINNYYLSFNFNEKIAFDNYENLKGEIILGELPHEYNKDKFSEESFKQEIVTIEKLRDYNFIFDIIYVGLKDKTKKILIDKNNKPLLKVIWEISYGLISGPDLYQNYIEENFFNKTEISNICQKMKDSGREMPYDIYVCDNEIKSKFNLFPELIFYLQNSDYNFTFNYEDLFMLKNNKYYFNVIFLGGLNNWRFGLPFFLKYQLVFNQDSKQIGFYTDFVKKEEEKSFIYNNIWFWVGISVVVIGIIIATIFITKKYFENKNRRKRANELDDGFDYDDNKEKKIADNEKNLLINDEENK